MWTDVVELARSQHGIVTRRQLIALGCTASRADGWVRRGRLERVEHGVYRVAGAPATPMAEVMAAVLRAGSGARAAGERLLAACGVRDAAVDGGFTVLVPAGRRLPAFEHRWRVDDVPGCGATATVAGVPTWNVARNLMEAAIDTPDDRRVATLADGVRHRARRTMVDVERLLVRHPSHAGGRRLLLLGCLDVDAAESAPERLLEPLLAEFRVRRQVKLADDIRVDLLLPDLRVVVEYDGSDHESGRARRADEERDRRLRELGYVVVRVTRHDLRDPQALLARIRRAGQALGGA